MAIRFVTLRANLTKNPIDLCKFVVWVLAEEEEEGAECKKI